MILRIVLINIIYLSLTESGLSDPKPPKCLTGYMTDLQSWVTRDGNLIVNDTAAIDLSHIHDVTVVLKEYLHFARRQNRVDKIKYLSVAKCQLQVVPPIFSHQGILPAEISESVEYVTFYGNNFGKALEIGAYESFLNATNAKAVSEGLATTSRMSAWSVGLQNVKFQSLRQLDLRACKIDTLDDFIFKEMPMLTHLYLGENEITFINSHAFDGLNSVVHIDLSRNAHVDEVDPLKTLTFESIDTFSHLNLTSLDLSFTPLHTRQVPLLSRLGNKLEILSICYTVIFKLNTDTFGKAPLKYLDLSGNSDVLIDANALRGLRDTLKVLYAQSTSLKSLRVFKGYKKLEILKASHNEIIDFPKNTMHTLVNLQILDLASNRISNWFDPIISTMPRLKLLSLENNNLNLFSDLMIDDISKINYISLSRNSIICQCNVREIYEIAFQNELRKTQKTLKEINDKDGLVHRGFLEYNDLINKRRNLTVSCLKVEEADAKSKCMKGASINSTGNFLFLDYDRDRYSCLSLNTSVKIPLNELRTCSQDTREMPDNFKVATRSNFMLLLILLVVIPIFAFIYIFRRNFRYFLITIRNSAMLSLISEKGGSYDEDKIFNYDVFVSYCNEDRGWVLDHLIPHVEIDCNISVCLHERDFQVGLSILENIVSCMDRSRSIMLIISKRFLISQWCQFEMHLAQHRLLETRREDLILILLEEIPRRLRPNTLHFLMLTKTYIVWPKEETEKKEFWKRMKKSLVTQKLKNIENDSLA